MARTNEAAVSLAIDTTLTTAQIDAFIADASAWVDAYLTDAGLTSAVLTLIEKYLACHFVTLRDPRLKAGKADDLSEDYQRDANVTEYLKAAAALDPTGEVESQFIAAKGRAKGVFRVGAGYA